VYVILTCLICIDLLCIIAAYTDYYPIDARVTVHEFDPMLYEGITIIDNHYHDYYYYKKYFFFHITGDYGVDLWIEICIDDDDYSMLLLDRDKYPSIQLAVIYTTTVASSMYT